MSSASSMAGTCADRRCDRSDDITRQVWYCSTCASCLCDVCWDFSPIHSAPGATKHTKLLYGEFLQCERLKRILSPPQELIDVEFQHAQDTSSTWFGIGRAEDGLPFLQDFDIYSQIMANLPGAGKSTVVKMLIDQAESLGNPASIPMFPAPVSGSPTHDAIPTSADVHLYCDPDTCEQERPILYADCEGLNAGERTPMGAHIRRNKGVDTSKRSGLRIRRLKWAAGGDKMTRQYAVTHLYPRLLYTFSDVVVYVVKEPKTFGSTVLPDLLKWAFALLEASTNHGTLPHAVIVVNCSKTGIKNELWDSERATVDLLNVNSHLLSPTIGSGHPELIKYADKWKKKDRPITSILDLIHCYYATFTIVRLPDEKNLSLLSRQVKQLRLLISRRCEESYEVKKRARLLASADDFGFYIQQAFSHFSEELDAPFDFKECALRINPIPQNLEEHILWMATAIQKQFPQATGPWIFQKLSFIVASCFLYDCVSYRKGQPQDLFGIYTHSFEKALEEFCSMHWPCEYVGRKGRRCVTVASRHDKKGHQNAKGKILAAGTYCSPSFNAASYMKTWMNDLKTKLSELQVTLQVLENQNPDPGNHLRPVRDQHLQNINRFYWDLRERSAFSSYESPNQKSGACRFQSHGTCLCCLMRAPEFALRCGHALCAKCVAAFARNHKNTTFEMNFCPLHEFETRWSPPWRIMTKPKFAGVRILTLDGGGIRGIVELEVLNQLQKLLEVNIPITAFFDLVVGTSTGGIIALALAVKQWTVERCIYEFKRMCEKAFTPREFHGYGGLQQMASLHHGSKWATTPFYEVLQATFGKDQSLFGGIQENDTPYATRVAVTSSIDVAAKGVVITNYCRKSSSQNYKFLRPTAPKHEMKLWEAAAATSAAAPFFKPFIHRSTQTTFLDGAFYNNNPIRVAHLERQSIWNDVRSKPPDLLLSIGTSQHREEVRSELQSQKRLEENARVTEVTENAKLKASGKWKHFVGMLHVGKAAYNRLEDVINCERQWQDFSEMTIKSEENPINDGRYVRINPDIKCQPPTLDAKGDIEKLQNIVSQVLADYQNRLRLEEVVFRLVASTFYYEKEHVTRNRTDRTATVTGRLQCRFEESSKLLKELGRFFKKRQRAGEGDTGQPYFEVLSGVDNHIRHKIVLTEAVIDRIESHGDFNPAIFDLNIPTTQSENDIKLYLFTSSGEKKGYSISGFPRDFLTEEDHTVATLLDASKNEISDWRPPSLDHPEVHRTISEPKGGSHIEERPTGVRSNTFHVQGASELEGSIPQNHIAQDHGRAATKSLGAKLSLRGLTSRPSRISLNQNSAPSTQTSTPVQAGEPFASPTIGGSKASSTSVPSLLNISTAPKKSQHHNRSATSTSNLTTSSSESSSYITGTNTSHHATPRSSLSMQPTSYTNNDIDEDLDAAIRASMAQHAKEEEERNLKQALEDSLLEQ